MSTKSFDRSCRWILHLGVCLIVAAVVLATVALGPAISGAW